MKRRGERDGRRRGKERGSSGNSGSFLVARGPSRIPRLLKEQFPPEGKEEEEELSSPLLEGSPIFLSFDIFQKGGGDQGSFIEIWQRN